MRLNLHKVPSMQVIQYLDLHLMCSFQLLYSNKAQRPKGMYVYICRLCTEEAIIIPPGASKTMGGDGGRVNLRTSQKGGGKKKSSLSDR
jgi:hypothetical protein